jgi:hypothetical protein
MAPDGISFDASNPKYRQFVRGDDILEYTLEDGEITVDWVNGRDAASMMASILEAEGEEVARISGYVTDKLGDASDDALKRLGRRMAARVGVEWTTTIQKIEGRRYLVFTK